MIKYLAKKDMYECSASQSCKITVFVFSPYNPSPRPPHDLHEPSAMFLGASLLVELVKEDQGYTL